MAKIANVSNQIYLGALIKEGKKFLTLAITIDA
jgi:hypothetical protein